VRLVRVLRVVEIRVKKFKGCRNTFEISGEPSDNYFQMLPEHDLGGLSNYLSRLSRVRHLRNCLDVGANIGLSSLLMAELAPSASIFSFEPSPGTFRHLLANIGNNIGNSHIRPHQFAIGGCSTTVKFCEEPNNSHASHLSTNGDGTDVEMKSVDDFAYGFGLDSVDFIKVDVEGFELPVFAGSVVTLLKYRPAVLFEFNEFAIRNNAFQDPQDQLSKIMNIIGALAAVDPLSGECTPLPVDPIAALEKLRFIANGEINVVDLTNQLV
jgi:FkbM family methyltransferase